MRSSWILLALAAATLVFLMVLRPGGSPDEQPQVFEEQDRAAPAEPRARRQAEATAEPRRAEGGERSDADTATDVDVQSEADRPQGGYDALGQRFHASDDYQALAAEMIEAAREGDPAAQYYLSRTLSECRLAVTQFDGEFPDEQRMAQATPSELGPELDQLMMDQVTRCRGFFEDDPDNYGHPDGWLAEAADQGYGPAVMEQGVRQFRHWQAGRDADFDPNRIVDTLRERNPDTLAYASQLSAVAGAPQEDEMAWLMLACEYGQDCSANSDWVRALCLQEGCPPGFENAGDALSLLMTPGELERARDRLQELEQAMDAGDFDSLFP